MGALLCIGVSPFLPPLSAPISSSFFLFSFRSNLPAFYLPLLWCIGCVVMGNTSHSDLLLFGVVQPSHLRGGKRELKEIVEIMKIMVLLSVSCCRDGFMFHLRPGPLCCFYMLRTTPLKNTARLLKGFSCNATGLFHFPPHLPKES